MKKIGILLGSFFILCASNVFAQSTVTLTTYYPAPFGMYQEMRVMGRLGAGTDNPDGDSRVHIVGTGNTDATAALRVEDSGGNPSLFVRDDRRVGIGTNAPLAGLHVAALYEPSILLGTPASSSAQKIDTASSTTHLAFLTNTREVMRLMGDTQRIGIGNGTIVPSTNVHLYDSSTSTAPMFFIQNNSTGDASLSFGAGSRSYAVGVDNSNSDSFKISYGTSTSNAVLGVNDRITLNTSGNVGIGLTSPLERLHVNGNIAVSGSNRTIFNRDNRSLALGTNNTQRMIITSDGKIGLNVAAPTAPVHIGSNAGMTNPESLALKVNLKTELGHLVVSNPTGGTPTRNVYVDGFVQVGLPSDSVGSLIECRDGMQGALRINGSTPIGAPYQICAIEVCYPGKGMRWNSAKAQWEWEPASGLSWKPLCQPIELGAGVPPPPPAPAPID